MKKQIIMLMAVAMIAMTLTDASARAQSGAGVTITIPFDFSVGSKTLLAGFSSLKIENRWVEAKTGSTEN